MDEKQAAGLLWEEWKYRHDLFWRLLFRWAGAVITLWVIPFLKPNVFKPWPWVAFLFPVLAFLLSLGSGWILGTEYSCLEMVARKYNELRKDFAPPITENRLYASAYGGRLVWVYAIALALLSLAVCVLLWRSYHTGALCLPFTRLLF
jgi:hypothetical protein